MPKFNWQKRVKLDNQLVLTRFDDSSAYDYMDIPDLSKNVRILRSHPTYKIMYEKYHNSFLLAKGSLNFILKWTAENDKDMDYYLANIENIEHIFPSDIVKINVDKENRIMLFNADSSKYTKNKWYNNNQHWVQNLPTIIEAAEDHTSMMCIMHDPAYKWNYSNVMLEANHSIEFKKTNPENEHYIFCMNNPVTILPDVLLKVNYGYKLSSDSIVISATQGDSAIAIIEKTTLVET